MPPTNTAVQLTFQVCPIVLSGGAASQIPGGYLPMLSLFAGPGGNSLGLPVDIGDLDNAFGAFNVLPGGQLVNQQIAKYPFANQNVAANATIREPLTLSVIMDAPMRFGGFSYKQMVMTALKATLDAHNNQGGTYIVITPAYMYTDLIMTALTDNSRGNNSLPQNAWRFDFEKPLVSLADAQSANQLMSQLTNGNPTSGDLSGVQPGSTGAQIPLAINPNTGLGTPMYSAPSTDTAQSYINYPATANPAAYSFRGVY